MNKNEILEKLDVLVSKEPSKWEEKAQYRAENKEWLKRSQAVALKILRTLREQHLSQKDLAEKMGVSAQQVNKWVKGSENFTFDTISKIEKALQITLISVNGLESNTRKLVTANQNIKLAYFNSECKEYPTYTSPRFLKAV